MTTRKRVLIIALACLALVVVGWGTIFAAIHASGGMITVRVQERSEDLNLFIPVPALVAKVAVDAGGSWMHHQDLHQLRELGRGWDLALSDLLEEFEELPDMVLVEVEDGNDHVVVRKEGRSLKVLVDDRDVTISISVPIKLARDTVESLLI